jgi:hypothetical protein
MKVHLSVKVPNEGARRLVRWMMGQRVSLAVLADRAGISAGMVVRMIEDGLVPAAGTIERIAGISGGFVRGWTKPARGWWFERPASNVSEPCASGAPLSARARAGGAARCSLPATGAASPEGPCA